ncbi:MAG: hypothetical protein GY948_19000 [Alphaproteobacteria bacterium]|nr:hypothetical protein [Alphaproteobacteria bacterium]
MAQRKGTNRGRRRQAAKAPVIDLEASEVPEETDAQADAQDKAPAASESDSVTKNEDTAEPSPQEEAEATETASEPAIEIDAEKPKSAGRGKLIAAGVAALLLAGAAGGAWIYKDIGADYFPPAASERQAARLAALETRIASLEATNANVSAALSKLTSELGALSKKFDTTSASTASQSKSADEAIALAQKANEQASQTAAEIESTKGTANKALTLAEQSQKATEAAGKELKSAQVGIDELKAAIAAAAESASSLTGDAGESVKAAQAQISGLTLKLSELERKLDAGLEKPRADTGLSDKIGQLDKVVAALQTSLADALKSQKADVAQAGKLARRDQMVQALSELTSNANAGQPFASALAVLESRLSSEPALQALSAVASAGVPSAKTLLGEFSTVHGTLSKTAIQPAPETAKGDEAQSSSFFSSLQSRLSSVIKIRPSGTKDWTKLGDEMAALAEKGNLTEMVQLADNVPETPPTALGGWLKKAKSRLALDRNLAALSAKAMEHLASTSKTGG